MLTQSEADALIAMPKKRANDESHDFPGGGETLTVPIISEDGRESFSLDVYKGRIRLTKCTFLERHRKTVILIRLDIDGRPHTNPEVTSVPIAYLDPYNGQTIQCPHLHRYVEGFENQWAIPVPANRFPRTDDLHTTLDDFFCYCSITDPPIIQRGLFIC